MFKTIDADNSGQITFEELKAGLKKYGANLNESEIYDLMQAVSIIAKSIRLEATFNIYIRINYDLWVANCTAAFSIVFFFRSFDSGAFFVL